jgi:uncharacterized protein DUF1579
MIRRNENHRIERQNMSTQAITSEYQHSLTQGEQVEPYPAQHFPKPGPEHDWLQAFVGEWATAMECGMEPGKPPMNSQGTERVRSIGGLWIVAEGKSAVVDKPMTSILTLGYDLEKKKYVGTWIDSCMTYLWQYEGSVDLAAKTLTLETEGPCPQSPETVAKFKEVMELKSKDHRVFTSSMQGQDGKWVTFATINYRRKK